MRSSNCAELLCVRSLPQLFPQLFWVSMAEMGSVHAHVFHMGAVTCTRLLGILYVSLEKVQNVLLVRKDLC